MRLWQIISTKTAVELETYASDAVLYYTVYFH